MASLTPADTTPEALSERLFAAITAMGDVYSVYLGNRLGYYEALSDGSPVTSHDLAARTGTSERYAREWLEHQAVTGILNVRDGELEAVRTFWLPSGHAEALTSSETLTYISPWVRLMVGCGFALPQVADAFRSGGGVPYEAYGPDVREGIADGNRPMFVNQLGSEWFPAMPDVHARLQADPPARVADIGCGSGWSSIAIARAYPNARVDGFDLDEASIEDARRNAESAGMTDRVIFHHRDAGDPDLAGEYDLACAFECIHDMANPVGALRSIRRLVGPGGTALVGDERAAETFSAPGDDLERLLYAFSVLHCLPVGMADRPSKETGAVIRPDTMRRYCDEAGFAAVDVLPIENDFWRFYRLTA
jgi:2-polyprenyl-3-methyl-5-hydroxy-6-metoxy-1,4-benzoquinol methylase